MSRREIEMENMSRRHVLGAAGAGTGLAMLAAATPAFASSASPVQSDLFPSQADMWADVEFMNSFGTRYPGSEELRKFCKFLDDRFAAAGLTVDRLERTDAVLWQSVECSITTRSGTAISVSSPNRESASTGPNGVTAPLKYCGLAKGTVFGALRQSSQVLPIAIPSDIAGKIALIEVEVEPLHFSEMYKSGIAAIVDPTHAGGLPAVQPSATAWNNAEKKLPPTLEDDLKKAGAVGVIYAWVNGADADGAGQIRRNGTAALPSAWVSVSGAKALRALEASGEPIIFKNLAKVTPNVRTATTIATLPGSTDETIILWTNTDGMNAIQENGSIAIINLMKYFARLPRSSRRRTISCVMSEGHLQLNHTQDVWWAKQRPDILEKAVASLAMEHLGCREWVGDPVANSYEPSGKPDITWAFTLSDKDRPNQMAAIMKEALKGSRLARTVVTDNSPFSFSPGLHPYAIAKVPGIGYITTAPYFLAEDPEGRGHIDKLSPDLYHDQVLTLARAIHLLDACPRHLLKSDHGVAGPHSF